MSLYLNRNAIRARLTADGIIGQDAYVVIAGPANTYAHYVTTIEEYGVQRYEGASTLFGPCKTLFSRFWLQRESLVHIGIIADTLDAYIDKYSSLVSYLADNATAGAVPSSDPAPPDLTSRAISLRVRLAFGFLKQNTTDTVISSSFNKRLVLPSTVQVSVITLATS